MKKICFLLLIVLTFSFSLSSCYVFNSGDLGEFGELDDEYDQEETPELTAEYIYQLAKASGYKGTLSQFIEEFKGADGKDGKDGVGIAGAMFDEDAHLILTLTNGSTIDCGEVSVELSGADSANAWHTGSTAPISSLGKNGDLYLNTVTCDVYKKVDGAWSVIARLKSDGGVVNEGDEYNYDITINADASSARYAAAKALMSAVRVSANFSNSWTSSGSGVIYILDKAAGDAYIITNYHVVYDVDARTANKIANEINVYLYGLEYGEYGIPATYVGGSMSYDIAVLKVTDSDVIKNNAVVAAELADSSEVRVLDTAIAVGNPASSGLAATLGSISVESEYIEMVAPDKRTAVEYRVMRIDTPVNSGNSGGGLFDSEGRLIGIVNAKENDTSIENMGYAIPSNLAVYVANNIIRNCDGKANEKVVKCRIGMMVTSTPVRSEYDAASGTLNVIKECAISEIETGSIAEVMLMVGDVLKSFEIDGVTYEIKDNYDGGEVLLNADVTSEIYVNVERAGVPVRVRLYTTAANFTVVS